MINLYLQAERVKFEVRMGQSKPIYKAFKAIKESPDWNILSDATGFKTNSLLYPFNLQCW